MVLVMKGFGAEKMERESTKKKKKKPRMDEWEKFFARYPIINMNICRPPSKNQEPRRTCLRAVFNINWKEIREKQKKGSTFRVMYQGADFSC